MRPLKSFDARIVAIHRSGSSGREVMDVRHEEFMAMAHAHLGRGFDEAKLAEVERLQRILRTTQADLYKDFCARQLDPARYVDEVNKIHFSVAQQCEAILGPSNFLKLFGVTPSEIEHHIDKAAFPEQA